MRKCMSRRDILCVEKNRNRHERPVGTHCAFVSIIDIACMKHKTFPWERMCTMHFDLPTRRPPQADDKFVTILSIPK